MTLSRLLVAPLRVDQEASTPLYLTPTERMEYKQQGMRGYHNGKVQIAKPGKSLLVNRAFFHTPEELAADGWLRSDMQWMAFEALNYEEVDQIIKAIDGDPHFPWHRELRIEVNRNRLFPI